MNQKKSIRRNEPCHCGSGKKYKKCHGAPVSPDSFPLSEDQMRVMIEKEEAAQLQREKQQGLGRPIISCTHQGYRIVSVGNRHHYSKKWVTFHDFLFDYIKIIFDPGWGNNELNRPLIERHPILQWYDHCCKLQKKTIQREGQVGNSAMTGAAFAYLSLSYNLYLLAHNAEVQSYLVKRLANPELFYPAYYETMVAAMFIKAGFTLELEDEEDAASSHAEFVAISSETGEKYSVEAKHRAAGKKHTAIRNQLYKALKKSLPHKRVIFIDLNTPDNINDEGRIKWLENVLDQLRDGEQSITINGKPAPEAYVFITNHPFLYNLDTFNCPPAAVAEGFKIPDFKIDMGFSNLRQALNSRDKHINMLSVMRAIREYGEIPSTWDGSIPEYTFGAIKNPQFLIGNEYVIPDADGKEKVGCLEDAVILENEQKVYGAYRLEDGRRVIATTPISQDELVAYRKHPDTFFGRIKKENNKKTKDLVDMYDFFWETYSKSTKENLLEFMKDHRDIETFKRLPQEELAKLYCEMSAYSTLPKP